MVYAAFQAGQMSRLSRCQRGFERPLDGRFQRTDVVFEAAGGNGRNRTIDNRKGVLGQRENLDANVDDPFLIQVAASFWAAIP
jgi:hypothetical protein